MRNSDLPGLQPIDRRKAKRIRFVCEVECEMSGVSRFSTRINDISTTGVFIDSVTAFPVDSILKLKFTVQNTPIQVVGQVRYCISHVGIGVQFLNLKPEQRAIIASLVEGKSTAERPIPGRDRRVLMGNFADVNFFDVVQIIENSRLTGALTLSLPSTGGQIYFNEGQIVGARSGAALGTDALNALVGASAGAFDFVKSAEPYPRAIHAINNTGLLLDLLAAKDEEAQHSLPIERMTPQCET